MDGGGRGRNNGRKAGVRRGEEKPRTKRCLQVVVVIVVVVVMEMVVVAVTVVMVMVVVVVVVTAMVV